MKDTIATLSTKLYDLLVGLESEDRRRLVEATMLLLGESPPATKPIASPTGSLPSRKSAHGGSGLSAMDFFTQKDPRNKGEQLAVAARYLEQYESLESCSKEDLKRVFSEARRNFDNGNFARDINNAKRQAGFFTLGGDRSAYVLSHYGHEYVDALPDREAATKVRRPKVGGKRGPKTARGKKK